MGIPYSTWTTPMLRDTALFVGGPLDGKRMAIDAFGDRYYVQTPRSQPYPCTAAQALPRPEECFQLETAVYMRTEVGARATGNEAHQYVLYVYGGIEHRIPRAGDQIVFRGVAYTVAVVHYDGSVRVAAKRDRTSILVAEKDLVWYWATEMWRIRDGANVEVRSKSSETAP